MGFQTSLTQRRKKNKAAGLNLVSLMDIFTILVFFLLMNSGDSQEIDKATFITLPDSAASGAFHDDLVILVGDSEILIDDETIVSVEEIAQKPGKPIDALTERLKVYLEKKGELNAFEKENGLSVTIMGDQAVPYTLLKSVMATCSQLNFRDISLAVNQVMGPAIATGGSL